MTMTPTIARALVGQLNLPTDCDCDNDDCVRCAHYPTIVENAQKELRDASPDLLAGYLAATDENERLTDELERLRAFVAEFAAASPDIISGRDTFDRSGQSDVPDMIEADFFYAWQEDARAAIKETKP